MKIVAVVTGDIKASRKIEDREGLPQILKEAFDTLGQKVLHESGKFEIYRGDSFQGLIEEPAKSLLVAILIRARLRQWEDSDSIHKTSSLDLLPDARIGIGIGQVKYQAEKIVESDGEAFNYSGALLDEMKHSDAALAIRTPWTDVNEELAVSTKLLDSLVSKWSSPMAEAVYLHFSEGYTQKELSNHLGISQPAVHKRLSSANIDAVQTVLDRFEKLIKKKSTE